MTDLGFLLGFVVLPFILASLLGLRFVWKQSQRFANLQRSFTDVSATNQKLSTDLKELEDTYAATISNLEARLRETQEKLKDARTSLGPDKQDDQLAPTSPDDESTQGGTVEDPPDDKAAEVGADQPSSPPSDRPPPIVQNEAPPEGAQPPGANVDPDPNTQPGSERGKTDDEIGIGTEAAPEPPIESELENQAGGDLPISPDPGAPAEPPEPVIQGELPQPVPKPTAQGTQIDIFPSPGTQTPIAVPPPMPSQRPPEGFGGGSHGPNPNRQKATNRIALEEPEIQADVICWMEDAHWVFGVDVRTMTDSSSLEIFQQGERLELADGRESVWKVPSLDFEIIIEGPSLPEIFRVDPKSEDHLTLFRLAQNGLTRGRMTETLRLGWYLVIAPSNWSRDTDRSGAAEVEPEPTSIQLLQAHYFRLTDEGVAEVSFLTDVGSSVVRKASHQRFSLSGNTIPDSSPGVGPFFVGELPKLVTSDPSNWDGVTKVVIGQEWPNGKGWRTWFLPSPSNSIATLPNEICERRIGWYFVRLYDSSQGLIESLDFKYASALQDISISNAGPVVDPATGYSDAVVEFRHDHALKVVPAPCIPEGISIESTTQGTLARFSPSPETDVSRWIIEAQNGESVQLMLDLRRFWWAVAESPLTPPKWVSKVLTISRSVFKPTSETSLWLNLPSNLFGRNVTVGFDGTKKIPVGSGQRQLPILLREFSGATELDATSASQLKVLFKVSKDDGQANTHSINIIQLPRIITNVRCMVESCGFETHIESIFVDHLSAKHTTRTFIVPVSNYDEFRKYYADKLLESLPTEIYRCPHCHAYVKADDPFADPTSAIVRHIEEEHVGERHEFKLIRGMDEIRSQVLASLPELFVCKVCRGYFESESESEFWGHIIRRHPDSARTIEQFEEESSDLL